MPVTIGVDPHKSSHTDEPGAVHSYPSWVADTLSGLSEATPMPIEPPTPSAAQLADWWALVERIRQGDRSQVWPGTRSRLLGPQPPIRSL